MRLLRLSLAVVLAAIIFKLFGWVTCAVSLDCMLLMELLK